LKKVAFHTLGCKVNIYETEAMQELMQKAGYSIVDFDDKADIYVVNTCSVTNMADRKSRQMLHKAKKDNPDAVIVAVGCYVQAAAKSIKQDEKIDIIIGNNMKNKIADIINDYYEHQDPNTVDISGDFVLDISKIKEYEEFRVLKHKEHTRAFIKIQDGCNQFCSYCIIPYTRGRVRSRSIEEIEKEVRDLVHAGYKEVILTGIHISSYGLDFEDRIQLIELVEKVAAIEGVKRLRISSLEPRIITEEFVERLAKLDNFCPHFHLSLQSGSDNTLKAMSRRYDASEFKEGVRLIRKYFYMPALTTDIIAGFPGETEDDFTESLEYIRDIGFFELHVFPYSKREGTKAASMKETLSNKDKTRRVNLLLSMQEPIRRKFLEEKIGKEVEVLIESEFEHENKRYVLGHSKEYIKVALPYIEKARNMIIPAKLISFIKDDIILGEELKQ
jgi:MiaB-like protein